MWFAFFSTQVNLVFLFQRIDCYVINDASDEVPEAMEIVKRVWERLRETHRLRVVQ